MKVYLVRHGQTNINHEKRLNGRNFDSEITEFGFEQVKKLGQQLKNRETIDLLRTSPLLRTVQTAKILENYLIVQKQVLDDRLIERDFGIFDGLKKEELLEKKMEQGIMGGELTNYFPDKIGKTEDIYSVHQRIKQCMVSDIEKYGDKGTVMYLTHAGVIHAFLGIELGIPEKRIGPFKIQEASYFRCELQKEHIIQIMELWNNELYE